MLQPLATDIQDALHDSEQGHCCCAVMENCLTLFYYFYSFAYVGITVVADN